MPIYDYQCSACGHELEALQKIADPVLTDCPACGQATLVKQVSAPNFRLSGSGWYETDFKTGDKKNLAGDKSSADSADSKGGADKPAGNTEKSSGGDGKKPPGKKTDTSSAA